jgi:hypothetical protein
MPDEDERYAIDKIMKPIKEEYGLATRAEYIALLLQHRERASYSDLKLKRV